MRFAAHRALDLLVGVVEEPLQLLPGERARFGIALVVVEVRDGVPLVHDRDRMHLRPELPPARRNPPVAAVTQVAVEQPQAALVAADRGRRQVLLGAQRQRPLVHMRRCPVPRVLVGELAEPTHQPLPRPDRILPQTARRLLRSPALQHRLDIASSGRSATTPSTSSRCAAPARSTRRNPPPTPSRRVSGGSCSRRDRLIKSAGQTHARRARGTPLPSHADQATCEVLTRLMQFPRVGVDRGGRRAGVPQHLPDLGQPFPGPQHLAGRVCRSRCAPSRGGSTRGCTPGRRSAGPPSRSTAGG